MLEAEEGKWVCVWTRRRWCFNHCARSPLVPPVLRCWSCFQPISSLSVKLLPQACYCFCQNQYCTNSIFKCGETRRQGDKLHILFWQSNSKSVGKARKRRKVLTTKSEKRNIVEILWRPTSTRCPLTSETHSTLLVLKKFNSIFWSPNHIHIIFKGANL